jgi:hypothetical protein
MSTVGKVAEWPGLRADNDLQERMVDFDPLQNPASQTLSSGRTIPLIASLCRPIIPDQIVEFGTPLRPGTGRDRNSLQRCV